MTAAQGLAALALASSLLAGVALIFVDSYSGELCAVIREGPGECLPVSATLLEQEGAGVLGYLAVPVVLAAGGVAATWLQLRRRVRGAIAVLLLFLCLLTGFSIGAYYLPAALLLLASAAFDPARPRPRGL